MKIKPLTKRVIYAAMVMLFTSLTGCTDAVYHGFNLLQTEGVKLGSEEAMFSMRRMKSIGSNSVVIIPFMRQKNSSSTKISYGYHVTDLEVQRAVKAAGKLGLRVILKPQLLLENGWAGDVNFKSEKEWAIWFASYSSILLHYADMAAELGIDVFVIGTELQHTAKAKQWKPLIEEVRKRFKGHITYAAHGVNGVEQFAHWQLLDSIGVTLYPSLGSSLLVADMLPYATKAIEKLEIVAEANKKKIFILEVGVPSANNAQHQPWRWDNLNSSGRKVNLLVQQNLLSVWAEELKRESVMGYLVWCWYTDPNAGGKEDKDYTVQGKPSEQILKELWQG